MKVALDVRPVGPAAAGIGQYTANLAQALVRLPAGPELLLLGEEATRRDLLPSGPSCTWRRLSSGPRWHLEAWRAFRGSDADLYHSPSSAVVPLALGRRAVVTVHDLVPVLYPKTSTRRTKLSYRILRRAVARAGATIAVSASTRDDLMRHWRIRGGVDVVHEAPREFPAAPTAQDLERLTGVRRPYFLAVGTVEPRKNLSTLVTAWELARHRTPRMPSLVLVGGSGWGKAIRRQSRGRDGDTDGPVVLGYRDDLELAGLYCHAAAFISPSLYEGFGLPALEAASLGAPVLSAASGAAPEVLGDAALFFDPLDPPALARLLERVASDDGLRSRLSSASRRRAAQFSWERTARETMAVYESVL